MNISRRLRRTAALAIVAVTAVGVVTVQAAGPAAAKTPRLCSQILTAGPGSAAGTVAVTFTETSGPYAVVAFDTELLKVRMPEPVAMADGDPSGTVLTGLQPSTEYWIYVDSSGVSRAVGCLSEGVKVMSGAVTGTDMWMQSYGRLQQADPCDPGWWASYGQWMHGGLGGWTCDRYVPKYG